MVDGRSLVDGGGRFISEVIKITDRMAREWTEKEKQEYHKWMKGYGFISYWVPWPPDRVVDIKVHEKGS